MAEAASPPNRFFCHRCSVEVFPRLPDYTCPSCESGFIEEMTEDSGDNDSPSTSSSDEQNNPLSENIDPQHLFTIPPGYRPIAFGFIDDHIDLQTRLATEDYPEMNNWRDLEMGGRHRYSLRQPWVRHAPRRQGMRPEGVPTLEGIIQHLVNGIITPTAMPHTGPWGMLHSNPMDYAWGANGLDAIITQLLNQFENTGPPPADRERIKSLPSITITEEHVGAGLECPVCKEDYSVEEIVRQLPCNHLFHNDCIIPWLEQHDTCPVCRKSLSGLNTATDQPAFSGYNYTSPPSSSPSSPSNESAASNS